MVHGNTQQPRLGFTILEIVAALAGLTVALVLVTELAVVSMVERKRNALRHAALETAANILESAQAAPWATLTPEWAGAQQLPTEQAQRLNNARLKVCVEPEPGAPAVKRVSVEIAVQPDHSGPGQTIQLTGWFGPRSSAVGGSP